MNSLESARVEHLKRSRAAIDQEITRLERESADRQRNAEVKMSYVAVVCDGCHGRGEVTTGGADILSDPPVSESCEECGGEGYKLARRFERKRYYSYEELQYEGADLRDQADREPN